MIPDTDVVNWIISPAANAVKYIADETGNAAAMTKAIMISSKITILLQVARQQLNNNGLSDENINALIDECHELEDIALEHIESDFHAVNSHALVGLWCALEVAVEDTIVMILMKDKMSISTIHNNGLKTKPYKSGPLNEAEGRRLYRSLEHQIRKSQQIADSFCYMLNIFGLRVDLSQEDSQTLAELNCVRNCILHRSSIIDGKAIAECPSLTPFKDKVITINREKYLHYYRAVSIFCSKLLSTTLNSLYINPSKTP